VKPNVGIATFWYDLNAFGSADMKTLHAGSSVINESEAEYLDKIVKFMAG
jgi:hypothetical protein